jgi:hypothetical protein
MHDDLSQDCWSILNLAPDAEISEIHRAFEQLRLSCLPKDRDRTAPLSDNTKERLQQLDRAFFLALESKNTKAALTNTTLTERLEPTLPVTQPATSAPSMAEAVEGRGHPKNGRSNLTTAAPTTKRCASCKAPIEGWLVTSFCRQCQPPRVKNTSARNHSIASEDLVSPQERSRSVGGVTASFASRVLSGTGWFATSLGTASVFVLRIFKKFSSLHLWLRALLGGTLALAIAWLVNLLSGDSGLTSNTGGNALFVGVILGILLKYRWWLLGLISIFLFERYVYPILFVKNF